MRFYTGAETVGSATLRVQLLVAQIAFSNWTRALSRQSPVGDSRGVHESSFQDEENNNLKKPVATSDSPRVPMLRRLLASLSRIPGVRSATVVDEHGRLRASLVEDQDDEVFSSEAPTALRDAEELCHDAGIGQIDQIWVSGSEGRYGLARLGAGAALVIVCDRASALGRMRHEVSRSRPTMLELI